MVFDITNQISFNCIKDYWYPQIKEIAPKNAIIVLAAAKCDLFEEEAVEDEDIESYAESIGAIFKKTSSLSNTGINELFEEVGKKILSDDNFLDVITEGTSPRVSNINEKETNDLTSSNNNTKKINKASQKKRKERCC